MNIDLSKLDYLKNRMRKVAKLAEATQTRASELQYRLQQAEHALILARTDEKLKEFIAAMPDMDIRVLPSSDAIYVSVTIPNERVGKYIHIPQKLGLEFVKSFLGRKVDGPVVRVYQHGHFVYEITQMYSPFDLSASPNDSAPRLRRSKEINSHRLVERFA